MVEVQEISQVLGLGLVATAPVAAGATIIEEEPLWTVSIENIFGDHAFLQRKDVQAIVASIAAGDTAPERANAFFVCSSLKTPPRALAKGNSSSGITAGSAPASARTRHRSLRRDPSRSRSNSTDRPSHDHAMFEGLRAIHSGSAMICLSVGVRTAASLGTSATAPTCADAPALMSTPTETINTAAKRPRIRMNTVSETPRGGSGRPARPTRQ